MINPKSVDEMAYGWLNSNGFYRFEGNLNFSKCVCIFKAGHDSRNEDIKGLINQIQIRDHEVEALKTRVEGLEKDLMGRHWSNDGLHLKNCNLETEVDSLQSENEELKKKLEIAVKALEHYKIYSFSWTADDALSHIRNKSGESNE